MLDREPVLVVPTGDDAAQFERDLCAQSGAVIGVGIRTFGSLFDEVARRAGVDPAPALSPPQRLALVRAAVDATPLRLLGRSSRRPGFAPALDALIAELQAALVSAAELDLHAAAARRRRLRARAGRALRCDTKACARARGEATPARGPAATIAALRASPGSWGGRPVLVYGFDDLTRAQFELISDARRGGPRSWSPSTTPTVTRSKRERGSRPSSTTSSPIESTGELDHDPSYTARESLRHLDRGLFEPGSGRVAIDGAVTLLECAGELGEAEAIGGRIAALLAVGVSPDAIAVVVRDPARRGPLLGRVLRRLAIPAAVEASVPLAGTAVGGSLVALCRAVVADDPEALLASTCAPIPSTPPGVGDTLELTMRRERPATIDEAVGGWSRPPRHLAARTRRRGPGPSGCARWR